MSRPPETSIHLAKPNGRLDPPSWPCPASDPFDHVSSKRLLLLVSQHHAFQVSLLPLWEVSYPPSVPDHIPAPPPVSNRRLPPHTTTPELRNVPHTFSPHSLKHLLLEPDLSLSQLTLHSRAGRQVLRAAPFNSVPAPTPPPTPAATNICHPGCQWPQWLPSDGTLRSEPSCGSPFTAAYQAHLLRPRDFEPRFLPPPSSLGRQLPAGYARGTPGLRAPHVPLPSPGSLGLGGGVFPQKLGPLPSPLLSHWSRTREGGEARMRRPAPPPPRPVPRRSG